MKAWWRSKTLWVNVIGGLALLAQSQWGFVIDGEIQAAILAIVNLALRLITNEAVGLKDDPGLGPFPGLDAGGPGVAGS